ncbi:hypothetical protein RI129_002796 [Pyrocoelia pectoralis]|uniref:Uncharacterized protein n=1 Tax=Pyrocoelia pectoralis TaxID=417401 RepID=A0AAN7VKN7_9COLE
METSNSEYIIAQLNHENESECNSSSPTFVDKPSSRRVSFASMNFVKKFAIDPEKNTIWDVTYEEMVSSDSTHASENAHGTLSARQTCPHSILYSQSEKEHDMTTSINYNTDRGEDMECYLSVTDYMRNKENVALVNNNVFSSNEESTSLPMCINTGLQRTNFVVNKTVLNNSCMEMTQGVQIIKNLKARSLSNITLRNMNETVDYTQCVGNENVKYGSNKKDATLVDNISIEYTCQIPTFDNYVRINRTIIENASMDLTPGIGTNEVIFGDPHNLSPSIMEQTVPITDFKLRPIYVRSNAEYCSDMDLSQNVIITNRDLSRSSFKVQKDANMNHTVPIDIECTPNTTLKTIQIAPIDINPKLSDSDMQIDETIRMTSKINTIDVILANDETIHSTNGRKNNCPTAELINVEMESKHEALAERYGNKTIYDRQNNSDFGNIQNLPQEVGTKYFRLDDNSSLNTNRDTVYAKAKCKKILDKSVDVLENNFEKSSDEIKMSNECTVAPHKQSELGSESIELHINKSNSSKLLESTDKHSFFKHLSTLYLDKPIVDDRITKLDEQNVLFNTSNVNTVGNMCDSALRQTSITSVKGNSSSEKLIQIENVERKHPKYLFALSPYADDTQHLINYNLSNRQSKSDFSKIITGDLNPSFINSKVMALSDFSCDTLPISLNNTRDITKDSHKKSLGMQATYIIDATSSKGLSQDKQMSSSNAELNITNETNAKHCNSLSNIGSSVNISQEDLTLIEGSFTAITEAAKSLIQDITNNVNISNTEMNNSNSESTKVKELWDSCLINCKKMDSSIQEYENKIKKRTVIQNNNSTKLQYSCKTQREVINRFHKEFKVTEFQDKHSHIESKRSSNYNSRESSLPLQTSNDLSQSSFEILTYEEQIRRKCKRSEDHWTIISIDDGLCQIHTLFKTLRLEMKFDTLNGLVLKTAIYDCISGTSDPTACLVHKNFKNRLSEKNIKSGVGEKYDILTLLDYVHINMQKMGDILDEFSMFSKKYNFNMDKYFMGTFCIINLPLRSSWTFSVDMSDLENISEKSINVATNSGKIYEKEMKKLMNRTSRGLAYLKKFLKDVKEYIDLCAIQKHG